MARDKTNPHPKTPTHERVLDAAEGLLAQGAAGFSMRELAEAAGLSFATPFNRFGSKAAIMLALSARRIAAMREQLSQATLPETACARVLAAVHIAASIMLESPLVSRAVMAAISAPNDNPGAVSKESGAFWADALASGNGLVAAARPLALVALPHHLAVAFRGVLSFWTAGEIPDAALRASAQAAAAAVLLGFVGRDDRAELVAILEKNAARGR